jgi:hypothetical protein
MPMFGDTADAMQNNGSIRDKIHFDIYIDPAILIWTCLFMDYGPVVHCREPATSGSMASTV